MIVIRCALHTLVGFRVVDVRRSVRSSTGIRLGSLLEWRGEGGACV